LRSFIQISTAPPRWLLHTSLSKEAEAKFQAMLDEANKSA
jgi:hypothetical protein